MGERLAVNLLSFCAEYVLVLFFFAPLEQRSSKRQWLGYPCLALAVILYIQPGVHTIDAAVYSAFNLFVQGSRLLFYWAVVSGYLWLVKNLPLPLCLYLAGFYTTFYTAAQGLNAASVYIRRAMELVPSQVVYHRLWMLAVVLVLEFMVAMLVHRFVRLEGISVVGWSRMGLVFITNFLMLYFKYSVITLQSAERYAIRMGDMLFYPLCAMGSVLVVLVLFESFQAGLERQKALEVEQLAQQYELRYVKRSTQVQADIKRIHHDMKNHLLAIRSLDHHQEVSAYVDSLIHELMDYDACVSTGLPALDAFLSEKLCQARLEQVQFNVCLDLRGLDFIAYTDLITIFGNAVDNALEAVRSLPPEMERVILLKSSRFANTVIWRFGNPYAGELFREGNRLLTGKPDRTQHGIGLKSIARAAERYGGSTDVKTDEKEKWFELTVLIPLP